jgi:phage terminase large subunit-like protein
MNYSQEVIEQIKTNKEFRKQLVMTSHLWFFTIYLSHYIGYEISDFHKEMFDQTESNSNDLLVIVAFRGSGKSTIISLSYVLWSILGIKSKKYPVIISQTQQQAKQILSNIKSEFENNQLLKDDFGPFYEESDIWRSDTLILNKYEARITALSTGENIRGLRHNQYRPDLIICDDVEASESVKTLENRDKTYEWFARDVVPAGDKNTKTIVIGNLLHEDALLMRLKKRIEDNYLSGRVFIYPIVSETNVISWPGKFPNVEAIETEKKKIGDDRSWRREYLLQIVPDDDQIITQDMLSFYDELPNNGYISSVIGVDLAISMKDSADYTAIIPADIYRLGDKYVIYILPTIINKRMNTYDTEEVIKQTALGLGTKRYTHIYIEKVGYQESMIERVKRAGFNAQPFEIHGQDKSARLRITVTPIINRNVLFPKFGAEPLIKQLLGFGVEKHDDLCDAFSILVGKATEAYRNHGVTEYYRSMAEEAKISPDQELNKYRYLYQTGQLTQLPYIKTSLNQ